MDPLMSLKASDRSGACNQSCDLALEEFSARCEILFRSIDTRVLLLERFQSVLSNQAWNTLGKEYQRLIKSSRRDRPEKKTYYCEYDDLESRVEDEVRLPTYLSPSEVVEYANFLAAQDQFIMNNEGRRRAPSAVLDRTSARRYH